MKKESLDLDFTNAYWTSRYSAKEEHIPFFLKRLSKDILQAGKYLNVIQECGVTLTHPHKKLVFSPDSSDYAQDIKAACTYASQTLLQLLLHDQQLLQHLQCLKGVFFLSKGDYLVHFIDLAHEELLKPVKAISASKIQSLLEISLKSRF